MLVFRSEAHVERWLAGRKGGATIPITKLAELAEAWWGDRLAPAIKPGISTSWTSTPPMRVSAGTGRRVVKG